uniref:Filament-like plant protein 7 n=1 Tax=Opuntia streptacantha TaxID=393608 RepID=A0A7C9ECM2_OPUST
MTDNKSWLWRKRSSEKNVVITDKVDLTSKGNDEEIHVLLAEKAQLERDLRDLSDKLSSALSECDAKDELAKKHAKTAQEALAGWEKAEAKALSLNQELDEAMKQRKICDERTTHLDAALKECMQQLRFVREDQEKRIHDVLLKASKELEETKMFLREKLAESDKKIAKLTADNSQLNKMLVLKEQVIEELTQQRAKVEADTNALGLRVESLEKENNSLRYEVRILEKEVDIRNEEREFNRRSADAAHKQHLENVKKIAKLESECQRLRVLVRKRLPGPAALAKMRSEADILQRDSVGIRRKKSNLNLGNLQLDYAVDNYPDSPGKKINILTEKICTLEEENNSLREALQQKLNELQVSRNMYAKMASKLSQVETHLEESPKGRFFGDTRRNSLGSHDLSLASMSDIGSDDKASCAGSWASALISELEHFRDGKDRVALLPKSVGISDINHFMDDFAEMEKLALVCVDKPVEYLSPTKNESGLASLSEATGKELALVSSITDANSVTATSNRKLPSKLSESVTKLIEIIEGINISSQACGGLQNLSGKNGSHRAHKNVETRTAYTVHVLQWKTSDLSSVLHGFLCACVDLLNGKADFEMFTEELTSALEWIINHCFSLQDVSSMKDEIKKAI